MRGRKIFWEALEFLADRPKVVLLWVPLFLASLLLGGFPDPFEKREIAWNLVMAYLLLSWVLGAGASAGTLLLLRAREEAKPLPAKEWLSAALERFPSLLGLNIVIFLIGELPLLILVLAVRTPTGAAIIALLFLVLWGIFWHARLLLAAAAIVLGGASVGEAASFSLRHTRKPFLPFFGFALLALILPAIVFALLGLLPGRRPCSTP